MPTWITSITSYKHVIWRKSFWQKFSIPNRKKNALSTFATVKNELGVKDTPSNFLIELDLQFKTWHSRLSQGSYFNIFCDRSLFYQIHDRFLSKSNKGIKKKIKNCLVVIKEIDH